MTTLRGIAQPSDCPLTRTLLAYWRKLLDELNRERSLEEMERLLEDLRGYEDPPENP